LESNSGIDAATTNSKLQLLGLNGVALDYRSLQLALAWVDGTESLKTLGFFRKCLKLSTTNKNQQG
jgi:hypothetical protein